MRLLVTLVLCCGAVGFAGMASAQRPAPSRSGPPTVAMNVALKVGTAPYDFQGPGTCTYAPVASIYGVVAEQWRVEQSDGTKSIALTLWRPKSGGGEMFSLSISTGGRSHVVNTVAGKGAPPVKGSGNVHVTPAGRGGVFSIDAKAADGTALSGNIRCDVFSPAMAEGGHE